MQRSLTFTYQLITQIRGWVRRGLRLRTIGVRALIIDGDQVVLVRHRSGPTPWSLPGGGPGHLEPLSAAAEREAQEEAGCAVVVESLHGLFHLSEAGHSDHVIVFRCRPLGPVRPPVSDLEIVDAGLFPFDRLPAGLDRGSQRRIAEAQAGRAGLVSDW